MQDDSQPTDRVRGVHSTGAQTQPYVLEKIGGRKSCIF